MSSAGQQQFQIIETVGKGGFGTVYRADMLGPGGFRKAVALKVLNEEMAQRGDFAERLRDEARILGLLNHRAIVRVDGLQQMDGRWTVVMEFVEGVDLKRVLERGPVPVGPALEMIEEVAGALSSAYSAVGSDGQTVHLLHRDIKPSNIHLTPRGEVKVLDFGVARADFQNRESETRSIFFGSVGYMAPERMDGIDSHAGDVYSLGVVLAELILGDTLGRSWANPDRHEKHRTDALHRLWAVCPDRELYDLVGQCLSYAPEHRPTAHDLARSLRGVRKRHGDVWLQDWAERVVPELMATRPKVDGKPSGGTLVGDPGVVSSERRGDTQVDPSASHTSEPYSVSAPQQQAELDDRDRSSIYEQPRRGGSMVLVGVGAAVAALLLVVPLGAGLAWLVLQSDGPAEEPRPTIPTVAPVEDDGASIDLLIGDDEPPPATTSPEEKAPPPKTDPPQQAKKPASSDKGAASSRKPPPEQAPPDKAPPKQPPPAASGRVVVTGDASSVRLVGGGTSYPPGAVPPGVYEVKASFGGGALTSAGRVTVPDGGVVTLSCRAGLKRCATR